MAKKPKLTMPLTDVIRAWRDEKGWTEEIDIDVERQSASLALSYSHDGQDYKAYVEAYEKPQWLKVYIYGPIAIPGSRYIEACQLVNHINLTDGVGRLSAVQDGKFQFRAVFDLEGSKAEPVMIENMISAGLARFESWTDEMGQVIFTGKKTEQILKELAEAEEMQGGGSGTDDGIPDKL